jgi:hypothetical protein
LGGSSQGGGVARRTKIAKIITTVRIPQRDSDAVYALARRDGVSQSQFLCDAIREKIEHIAIEQATAK